MKQARNLVMHFVESSVQLALLLLDYDGKFTNKHAR